MSSQNNEVVDMSKLTQRELLIRLHDKVDRLEIANEQIQPLRDRVTKVETKMYVVGAAFGVLGATLSIIINAFKIFQ